MASETMISWRGLDVESLERVRFAVGSDGIRAESVIDSARGRYAYELTADRDWVFRSLRLEALAGERTLTIEHDGDGGWTVDGVERGDLAEAREIDLAISPLTNTLPIRRLDLALDDEDDIVVAFVSFPDLEVTTDPQRYTRIDEDVYLFESLDTDWEREITVDPSGLVIEYPGLFERL